MGQHVVNLSTQCDYATPEKETTIELHMALPIPYIDLEKVQNWLGQGDWVLTEEYLCAKYPQHRALLADWLSASQKRSQGHAAFKLAAVGQ